MSALTRKDILQIKSLQSGGEEYRKFVNALQSEHDDLYAERVSRKISHILSRIRTLPTDQQPALVEEMKSLVGRHYQDIPTRDHVLDRFGQQAA